MTAPKTTLVIILLASDTHTYLQLDPALEKLHRGLSSSTLAHVPDVFCFYMRALSAVAVESHMFPLRPGSLQFTTSNLLDMAHYPPADHQQVTGDFDAQLAKFISYVNCHLTATGPIRVILGAHGYPGRGFAPTSMLRPIVFAARLLFSEFDPELKPLTFAQRYRVLRDEVFRDGPPIGGVSSRLGLESPDLTLDETNTLLAALPSSRLSTLILHTCQSSGVETILALRDVPHQIACESALSLHFQFHNWFNELSDPATTDADLTTACLNSLQALPPVATGLFSSHRSGAIVGVIALLNQIGDAYHACVTDAARRVFLGAVQRARVASAISEEVDLDRFCRGLHANGAIPATLSGAVTAAIQALQLAPAVNIGMIFMPGYSGISVFLPNRGETRFTVANLPNPFRAQADRWCSFVTAWQTSTP